MVLHLDGQLSQGDEKRLKSHLDRCGRCSVLLSDALSGCEAARGVPAPTIPDGFMAKLSARIEQYERSRPAWLRRMDVWSSRPLRPSRSLVLVAVAACLLAFLFPRGVIRPGEHKVETPQMRAYAMQCLKSHASYAEGLTSSDPLALSQSADANVSLLSEWQ